MSTLILNGSGTQLRVTNKDRKATKPLNILMVTRSGVKRVNVSENTLIKFAA